ncbi:hypothetical protein Halhy_1077 [Haliscomenobacter hydrossis DSM 1100]|uniref:Uncharacterized protein n=1 Tax=Haliscomenobacter hydrossis (strain ATCC 27775 / DSM 1100 / LMG 10767 / O) TaxID=760192 RepID=F4KQF0_HALH1|nr:hypothetical protein Halhy_1077 [Haliscomenobacter hydrossis DSM 1100]
MIKVKRDQSHSRTISLFTLFRPSNSPRTDKSSSKSSQEIPSP